MATRILLVAAIVAACAHSLAVAQEVATDAERTYGELRSAKDARTRLLGERWSNLIRLQEWNDATGKFATTAKYVEHDPELQWVKLRMIKGTGANRVVKDVTIPVAKLSKTCQSRVRQISVLREKVATAAIEAAKAKEADATEAAGNTDIAGQPDLTEPAVEEASFDGERATGPPQADVVSASERPPLPARLPPLPAGPIGPSNPPAENSSTPQADDSHR
jgi:hypothetical protein